MAQFNRHLITLGGVMQAGIISKVHRLKEESQKWEEFHKPMPTPRFWPSVATVHFLTIAWTVRNVATKFHPSMCQSQYSLGY